MKKVKLLRVLTGISALATAASSVFASDAVNMVPKTWAPILLIGTTALLAVKELVVVIGDYADDGERNNSFKG